MAIIKVFSSVMFPCFNEQYAETEGLALYGGKKIKNFNCILLSEEYSDMSI